jgi:hypothetical protein
MARASQIDAIYDRNTDDPPWTTIVPDFLGWPASELAPHAAYFQLEVASAGPAPDGARVCGQDLAPGTSVAAGTTLNVQYVASDPDKTTFAAFPGTHPVLKDMLVRDAYSELGGLIANWTPWPVARTYFDDAQMKRIVALVEDALTVKIPGGAFDEPLLRSLNVIKHWSMT